MATRLPPIRAFAVDHYQTTTGLVLGAGVYSQVVLGETMPPLPPRPVALKIMKMNIYHSITKEAELARGEIINMRRVKHKHLVEFLAEAEVRFYLLALAPRPELLSYT